MSRATRPAQLAAILSIDDRYLKAEGLSLNIIKGCIPVDGDTYDVPAIIEVAETRSASTACRRSKTATAKNSATTKPSTKISRPSARRQRQEHSAVLESCTWRGIRHDRAATALASVLKDAGIPAKLFGGSETTHSKINADIGLPDTPKTKDTVFQFVADCLKK